MGTHKLFLFICMFLGIGFLSTPIACAVSGTSDHLTAKKEPLSIVIIDHLRVRDSSKEVSDIKKQVDGMIEKLRKEILEKETILRKEYNDLVNKKPKSGSGQAEADYKTEADYKKKLADFRARLSKLQVASRKNKNTIERAYRKAMDSFSHKFTNIIMDFQRENDIDIMLRRENVLFYRRDLDRTDELIERINKDYKTIDLKVEKEDLNKSDS